ncbi:MAG TPA: hypothetical protein VIL57_01865 [Bacteroidia bacterium]
MGKAIVILLVVLLILSFIRKYIKPVVDAANNVNENAKRKKTTITYVQTPKKSNKRDDDDAEYIEYKEIK